MPTNMHLKIDTIKGESQIKGHENQIQIDSFNFSMSQQASSAFGSGSGTGRVQVRDVVLTKSICKADAALMQHCCSGKHIPEVTIYCEKAGGEATVEYVKIVLKQVIVTNHTITGAQSGDAVHVDLSLNFAEYVTTYKPQSKEGVEEGETTQGWNIAKNTAAA